MLALAAPQQDLQRIKVAMLGDIKRSYGAAAPLWELRSWNAVLAAEPVGSFNGVSGRTVAYRVQQHGAPLPERLAFHGPWEKFAAGPDRNLPLWTMPRRCWFGTVLLGFSRALSV